LTKLVPEADSLADIILSAQGKMKIEMLCKWVWQHILDLVSTPIITQAIFLTKFVPETDSLANIILSAQGKMKIEM